MIQAEAKFQKINLVVSLAVALLVVLEVLIFDTSFVRSTSHLLAGLAVGYVGFAIYDFRNVMNQVIYEAHPNSRRS